MAHVRKKIKLSRPQFKSRAGIDVIVRDVRNFEFKRIRNWIQAKAMLDRIKNEWSELSDWYQQKFDSKKLNPYLAAEYEAHQQMIFCLMGLLNAKILDFFDSTIE